MNTTRNIAAIAAIALFGAVSAMPASAQELTRAQVQASVIAARANGTLPSVAEGYGYDGVGRPLNGTSTLTREQVKAETRAAIASGEVQAMMADSYGDSVPTAAPASTLTRAEVRAATAQAVRSGQIEAQIGDSYGDTGVVSHASRRAL